jgi:outer membrane lipoprotein
MTRPALFLTATALSAVLTAGGCATPAFEVGGDVDRASTPRAVALDPVAARDRTVAWGGVIVATANLKDSTQIEIVGYPLDDHNRPKRDADQVGRFLVLHPGYLESADYAAGREITVVGKVAGTRAGTVGEAAYVYPVVETRRMHLWPKPGRERTEPSIHFGIGIGISR